jgi:ATP-dependent RNA helicase HelY
VVIEKLSKFTGERHEFLTPGEYTQLTGRAGRRGIDEVGYAVVLWSPYVPFDQVAGLASTRTYALRSSFRPTYNMACNLVRRYPPDAARHLLNLSFAQYTSDRDVVRLEAQVERTGQLLAAARRESACELGDVEEYRRRLRAAAEGDGDGSDRRTSTRAGVVAALERVKPGDVLLVSGGKSAGKVAVISTASRKGDDVRIGALTPERRYLTLSARDFRFPPRSVGRIELPVPYSPRNPVFRREVAQALGRLRPAAGAAAPPRSGRRAAGDGGQPDGGFPDDQPVAGCPDLRRHLRGAERADRLEKDLRRLERRISGRTESLGHQFDRVMRVLEAWGYVDGWSLTEGGEILGRIYHECDLLVAEAIRAGLFEQLEPTGVAAMASTFTYEARRPDGQPAEPWFPSSRLKRRWTELEHLATELNQAEDEASLPLTRRPDAGFVALAHGWAAGEELAEVIADEALSGGDFVRNVKQLIDLVRQLGDIAPDPATAKSAREAADRLFRGVVAASSVVGA